MKSLTFRMKHQSKYENIVYVALWGMLFAVPLLSLYVHSVSDSNVTFEWAKVFVLWRKFAIYLVLFLVHNFLLAPLLVYGRKRMAYYCMVTVVVAAFTLYQCNTRPPVARHFGDRPPMERRERPMPPHSHHEAERLMPPPFGERDIMAIVVLILMNGMNLGIKFYFKNRDDQQRLVALEKENLEQQLEYLKYQINPHFFMNTLNNIHALVDIDPQKAQATILELSKMMRFILYEGDKQGVPLTKEFEFIRNYVTLMRLRFTDKVRISVDLPAEAPDKTIPPLMLISFIENAFKHGISYQHDSFVDVKVELLQSATHTSQLFFRCRNSKADKPNQEKGGVGLKNVRQRLHLLYDNNFTLNIQDEADIYNVELTIPLT